MEEADFSGYATKANLRCSDGRTIIAHAFKDQDGTKVPLVWQHMHNDPSNVLGHAVLENREDGVYAYGFFNDGPTAEIAKGLVKHGDIEALSIYANKLIQKGADVLHGSIKEVSLVLAGANPGAFIDNVNIAHNDGYSESEDEAVIYSGLLLDARGIKHEKGETVDKNTEVNQEPVVEESKSTDEEITHAATAESEKTIKEIFDAMTEEQKNVVYYMVGEAVNEADSMAQSDESDTVIKHEQEGSTMTRNVFEQNGSTKTEKPVLSHSELQSIIADAQKTGSFKEAFLAHAVTYGIENIDFLFPDAKLLSNQPEFVKRRTDWVASVINGVRKSPFSRIKTMSADITLDEARAKGYVKGTLKKEEFFALTKRTTIPTTIYKKQKLDRDDMIDITDLDVVAWLKSEMRLMLDEEIARAILIGDGREPDSDDKINESNIRPILWDDNFYSHKVTVTTPAGNLKANDTTIDEILRARKNYKGTGNPAFYTTEDVLVDMLLIKDTQGRKLYPTVNDLTAALRVSSIVPVEVMETVPNIVGIMVNLTDYTVGADNGGNVSMFDDFDIDYNQYKYLIEGRMSGALTKPKSALVIIRSAGTEVTPVAPTFVASTGVVTIPAAVTGIVWKNKATGATLSSGAQTALAAGASVEIVAVPSTGYVFPHNFDADWVFTRNAA